MKPMPVIATGLGAAAATVAYELAGPLWARAVVAVLAGAALGLALLWR